jgi:diadenosine tetraphosphate (Ap4A) HIT family hydrolase
MDKSRIILENDLSYAIFDGYPVTRFHALLIPKRHVRTYFDLSNSERDASHALMIEIKEDILSRDESVEGFNIGINNGEVAGQTIFHCHIHLIPRRRDDVENPRGGIRHVIPGKGDY